MFKKSLILIFSLLFIFTISASAQRMGSGMGMGHRGGMHKMDKGIENVIIPKGKWWKNPEVVEKLNLTDDQINKIDSIYLNYMDKLIDLKAQLEKKVLNLKSIVENDNFDRNEVLKDFDEISAVKSKIQRELLLMKLDIRDQLTPEQRSTLKTLRKNFRKKMMMRRMKMRRGGKRGMRMR